MSNTNTSGKGAGIAPATPQNVTSVTVLSNKKDTKTLGEVLEIIARNHRLIKEREALQNAIDELMQINDTTNRKVQLSIEVEDENGRFSRDANFSTCNINAIKLAVKNLVSAFEAKKTEIEQDITLN